MFMNQVGFMNQADTKCVYVPSEELSSAKHCSGARLILGHSKEAHDSQIKAAG